MWVRSCLARAVLLIVEAVVSYLLGLLTLPILIGVLGVIYILVELLTARASRRRERYAAAEIEASSTT